MLLYVRVTYFFSWLYLVSFYCLSHYSFLFFLFFLFIYLFMFLQFFEMPRHEAVKALEVYKRAIQLVMLQSLVNFLQTECF